MAIVDTVRADLQSAMRAGEKERVGALRLVLSELQKAAKEGSDDELAVLRRERKRRVEAAESDMIGASLPAELSDSELEAIVERAVRESGAESARDIGKAMKHAIA